LRKAVEGDYYFQMFLDDDLPVWGFIGKVERVPPKRAVSAALREGGAGAGKGGAEEEEGGEGDGGGGGREEPRGKPHDSRAFADGGGGEKRLYLFTHFHFDVGYNGDRVIELNVSTAAADPTKTVDITAPKQPEGGGIALEPPREIAFSYSARWREVDTKFEDRMDRFSRYSFLPQHLEIHWFSIVNSCVTVLLLTGFLATILLRVLRADLVRYARGGAGGGGAGDDDGGESGLHANNAAAAANAADDDETGWKHLHGDVFRFPPHASLFAAFVGAGTQLLLVAACVFALALLGTFYPYNRGAMMSGALVLYALTAGVAGFSAACWYRMLGGKRWAGNVILTAALFCGPLFAVFAFANSVAWIGGSTQALPAGTIVALLAIWLLVTLPLTVLGGAAGKSAQGEYDAPCRTAKFPRQIPPGPWYRSLVAQMAMAGFLPFSAIYIGEFCFCSLVFCFLVRAFLVSSLFARALSPRRLFFLRRKKNNKLAPSLLFTPAKPNTPDTPVTTQSTPQNTPKTKKTKKKKTELYYVFATVWGHKVYVVYPILAIVYGLVIVVTAFVTVALTYFQLASEDHRWWWRSFLCGGSTGLFVAGYCVFYWIFRSDMRGLLQGAFYFGYNAVACYGLFLMLGNVGFRASNAFVRRIYHEVKLD
jgi:hypothetical protein